MRRTLIAIGALVLFLVAVALSARDVIERLMLERSLAAALGGPVSIGALRHDGALMTLAVVHAQTADGALTFDADTVAVGRTNGDISLRPRGTRVAVTLDRLERGDLDRVRNAAGALGSRTIAFRVEDASLVATHLADASKKIEIAGITGHGTAGDCCPAYDVAFNVVGADGAFPGAGRATTVAGRTTHVWTAASLPATALGALLPTDAVTVAAGIAENVNVEASDVFSAKFVLRNVAATIAGRNLRALAGPVVVTADGIGSPGIDGLLEGGVPIGFSGEAHDLGDWPNALATGSRDLHALAHLFGALAEQPRLRWVNLETTAPGIAYGQYAMSVLDPKTKAEVPHVVQLLTVDPHEPTLHFDTALAEDHIVSHGERTSDLGVRTKAVAGVNGDYFDIGRSYEPQGMLMRSGALLHGPTDREALVIDRHNTPTFSVFHLRGEVRDGARTYPITQFNAWPARYATVVTPDYGKELRAAPGVTFAALAPLGGTRYRVTGLTKMDAPLPARFGIGFGNWIVQPLPKRGDVLDVSYALDPPVAGAVAAIGSGPRLLKDGAWFEDKRAPAPEERDVQWPVVAVGVSADKAMVFAAVDGRHPERSIGMTRPEFAELLRGFGVTDAMALDSGGSVTMVARSPGSQTVTLHNAPSDNSLERYIADGLFVYSTAPAATIVTTPKPHVEPTPGATPHP